jgi:hypothetical protein
MAEGTRGFMLGDGFILPWGIMILYQKEERSKFYQIMVQKRITAFYGCRIEYGFTVQ